MPESSQSSSAPVIHRRSRSAGASSSVWLRVSAFLSLKAPNTRETYLGIINEWCSFLGAEPGSEKGAEKIIGARDLHAIAYRAWLEKRPGEKPRTAGSEGRSRAPARRIGPLNTKKSGLEALQSNATIAKKFAALRRIYRMLMAAGVGIELNPFDSDTVPPPPKDSGRKRNTRMVDFRLVKSIVRSPGVSSPKSRRDCAILAALFGAGLRRSEVVSLRVGDVRKSSRGTTYLYLRATKGKKDAEQALPQWAARYIEGVLVDRREMKALGGDFLFISYRGKGGNIPTREPLSPSGVYKLFKHYCELAGAGEFLTPHSARATAITKLLADGIPHREVQEFSRHSSIQMVELYDKRRIGVDENPAKDLDYE